METQTSSKFGKTPQEEKWAREGGFYVLWVFLFFLLRGIAYGTLVPPAGTAPKPCSGSVAS